MEYWDDDYLCRQTLTGMLTCSSSQTHLPFPLIVYLTPGKMYCFVLTVEPNAYIKVSILQPVWFVKKAVKSP